MLFSGCSGYEDHDSEKPLNEAPEAVNTAFMTDHPAATEAKWYADGDNFEVDFVEDGIAHSAVYAPSGERMEAESSMEVSELMPEIHAYLDEHHAGWTVESAEVSRTEEGTVYEVVVSLEAQRLELFFDEAGTFTHQVDA